MPSSPSGRYSASLRSDGSQTAVTARGLPLRRTRRKQARPGELTAAALEVFVSNGFAATRVEEVAARAGVSKGTLFLYFDSKEALFKAVVRENIAGRLTEGAALVDAFPGPTAELLPLLIMQWWKRIGATEASGIVKLMVTEARHFPELARFYEAEVIRPALDLIHRVIQRGIDRGEFRAIDAACATHALISPLICLALWKHSPTPFAAGLIPGSPALDPERFLAQHADIAVRGLLKDIAR